MGKQTDEEERATAIRGECPICHAKDGERCTNAEGKPLAPAQLHAGRLRASKAN